MTTAMDPDAGPPELQLAAVLYLISSSALRGISEVKTRALLGHLHHLAVHPDLPPVLRNAVAELIELWSATPAQLLTSPVVAVRGPACRSNLH
jgi:hypothetical protein